MNDTLLNSVLAWLLTYAIHSTLLLGGAWLITKRATLSPMTRDVIWKATLVGGIITATAQQAITTPMGQTLSITSEVAQQKSNIPQTHEAKTQNKIDQRTEAAPASLSTDAELTPVSSVATPSFFASFFVSFLTSLSWTSALVLAWAALALLFSVTYIGRRLILIGRLANRHAVAEGPLPSMLDALCRTVDHRRHVRLTWVNTIASPVALGGDEICLPEAALTDLRPEEQKSLLAHELAHLARRDPQWLAFASLIERVFFFQPLNRAARAAIQRNAEFLCDDWAATQTGSGLPLAHCLERVAEWMEASPLGVPVAGMAEQRSLLVTRIARLIEARPTGKATSRVALALGTVVVLAVTTAAAPGVRASLNAATTPESLTDGSAANEHVATNDKSVDSLANDDGMMGRVPSQVGRAATDIDGKVQRRAEQEIGRDVDRNINKNAGKNIGKNIGGPGHNSSGTVLPQDTAVVSALIERLKDSDASVRKAAASSLGNLKSRRAVNALIAAAGDRNRDVRNAVIEALKDLEDVSAVPVFLKALSDESADIRRNALDALSNFNDNVKASSIVPLLKDEKSDVRRAALDAIKEIGDASVASSVTPLLKDREADVREGAIDALCELKVMLPERDVAELLGDPSPDVRAITLEYIKDRPTSYPLVAAITKLLNDPNGDVREHAVEALSEYRDPAARAALRAALNSEDPNVRRRAAEALGERK